MCFLWTSMACAVILAATLVSHGAGEVSVTVPVGGCFTLPSKCSSATNELICCYPRDNAIYWKGCDPEIQKQWQNKTPVTIPEGLSSLDVCTPTLSGTNYCDCPCSSDKVKLTGVPESAYEGTAKSSITTTTNTTTGKSKKISIAIGVFMFIVVIVVIVVIVAIVFIMVDKFFPARTTTLKTWVKSCWQGLRGQSSSKESGTDEEEESL